MSSCPDRETLFQEAVARSGELAPSEGREVLLHSFLSLVGGMDARAAAALCDQLSNRFGGRYCSQRLCAMMTEILHAHLEADQRPGLA